MKIFEFMAAVCLATACTSGPVWAQETSDVFDWSGFYIGADLGAASTPGNATSATGDLFPAFFAMNPGLILVPGDTGTLTGTGANGGAIAAINGGYNWQDDRMVLGVEADVARLGLPLGSGSATRFAPPFDQTVTVTLGSLDWMASLRGRVGIANDKTLFYLTAGGAVAAIGGGATTTVVNGSGIIIPAGTFVATTGGPSTALGWTIGAGIEVALNENWSLGAEYRHSDFGSRSVSFNIPDGLGGVFATGTANQSLSVGRATISLKFHPD